MRLHGHSVDDGSNVRLAGSSFAFREVTAQPRKGAGGEVRVALVS